MKEQEFIKILKLLGTSYNKEFDKEQAGVWYSFLKNYKYGELLEAIKNIISKNKYMPSIAEVKEEIANLQTKNIPKAEDEWEEVLKAVRKYGYIGCNEALNSLKPYTAYITRHIGFLNICDATPEQQTWNKKEFIGEYNILKDKEIENIQIGVKERIFLTNNTKNLENKEVKLIGE